MLKVANATLQVGFDRATGELRIIDQRDPQARITSRVAGRDWTCRRRKDGLSLAGKDGELLEIELRDGHVVLNAGIVNRTGKSIQVKELRPLRGLAFAGLDVTENFAALDGTTGCCPTKVWKSGQVECRNNLLAKFGSQPTRCLVIGGLTYHDFEKFARIDRQRDRIEFEVWSADPVGRRVEPGECYLPDDKVYVDISSRDPFAALEQYARCVREAQGITLPTYDFPTVCLWWASQVGPKANDTLGAVREMDAVVKSGFLKYSRVGIRLLPDSYDKNNCDGWWDDAHWAKCAPTFAEPGPCYKKPYDTSRKWCQAILQRGGVPIGYMRANGRSEDYAQSFPGHMLFNDSNRQIKQPFAQRWWEHIFPGWTDAERNRVGYDFTDPDFLRHMRAVYAHLKRAGLAGIFYDYPKITGWCHEGGFEDKHATTAKAYRNIFAVAQEGLGTDAYLQERAYFLGSDVSLGLVASQRTIWDNTTWAPPVITRAALRWYKNRVVMQYDTDGKQMLDEYARNGRDGGRAMLTMTYVGSSRCLIANSFSQMTPEMLYDLSRIIPFHAAPQSARPLDLFENRWPQVYDFRVDDAWHQLTFYNTAVAQGDWPSIDVDLAAFTEGRKDFPGNVKALNPVAGQVGVDLSALGLDPGARYHVYDFWNDRCVGIFNGNARLEQQLRPSEARMMSVHRVEKHPQFLSTDRHVMQGYVDLVRRPAWNGRQRTLAGTSNMIGGEPYRVVLAGNGWRPVRCSASGAAAHLEPADAAGLWRLTLRATKNRSVSWKVAFRKVAPAALTHSATSRARRH